MKTFFTLTDVNTELAYTNSRSRRFNTEEEAIAEARERLTLGSSVKGIFVLKAIGVVERDLAPVKFNPTTP